jgi:sulfite exporter TauE/SafE
MESLLFLSAALTLGLVTGLHCVGMCGPLALALPRVGNGRTAYVFGRILYNVGRAVTYAAMGALLGLLGRSFALGGFQRHLSIAAGLFLLIGVVLYSTGAANRLLAGAGAFSAFARIQSLWSRLFRHRSYTGLFALGLVNGLLPCGPVYVALAAATATGSVTRAALFMFVFGLGTLPMMLAVSLAGGLIQQPMRKKLQKLVPVSAGAVAVLLIVRGLALGIPFLSPPAQATEIGGNPHACCGGTAPIESTAPIGPD